MWFDLRVENIQLFDIDLHLSKSRSHRTSIVIGFDYESVTWIDLVVTDDTRCQTQLTGYRIQSQGGDISGGQTIANGLPGVTIDGVVGGDEG